MPFNLRFEVAGEEQIGRALLRFAEGVTDYTEPFNEIANDFLEVERRLFDSEGGTGGSGAWKPLSKNYAEWKDKHFPGAKILHRWEIMRESLTQFKANYSIRDVQKLSVTLGTEVPYAIYHQQGRGLPQRKAIDLNETDKQRWMKFIQQFLVEKKREAGL